MWRTRLVSVVMAAQDNKSRHMTNDFTHPSSILDHPTQTIKASGSDDNISASLSVISVLSVLSYLSNL
jgi:hypothetical protein